MSDRYDLKLGLLSRSAMLCLPGATANYPGCDEIYPAATCPGHSRASTASCWSATAPGLTPYHSSAHIPTTTAFASPARHGAHGRTVHQERYNPLKAGFEPQEA
jgi:hypothetical protein